LGDGKEPKGSRILGPAAKELKEKGFSTIAMMASELL
jgi:ribosomal protein L14